MPYFAAVVCCIKNIVLDLALEEASFLGNETSFCGRARLEGKDECFQQIARTFRKRIRIYFGLQSRIGPSC